MALNGRGLIFVLIGCGLVLTPAAILRSQEAGTPAAQPKGQQPSAAAGQDQSEDPNYDPRTRERSDKERYKAQRALRQEKMKEKIETIKNKKY